MTETFNPAEIMTTESDLVVKFIDQEKKPITKENLTKVVEATKTLEVADLKDKEALDKVHTTRINLRDIRVHITKYGLKLRADATAYNKEVIRLEDELVAVIKPEEERLAKIEDEAKQLAIREERLEKLPARKARLAELDLEGRVMTAVTDEFLLSMDSEAFEAYYNSVVAERNELIRMKQLEEQAKADAEIKRQQDEEKAKLKAEQDKIDEEKKKIDDANAELAKREQALADEKAKLAQEEERKKCEEADRLEAIKKQEEEKKKQELLLAKREQFKAFLVQHGRTEDNKADFKTEEVEGGWELWKKVGVFNK
jgi:unconventional prefoldin RPB5 interactor 1